MSPNRQSHGKPTTLFDPFDVDARDMREAILKLFLEAQSVADRAQKDNAEDIIELTVQGTKLLLKRLAAAFPVNDPVLNAQLGRRLLKKDKELFSLLAALQILSRRTEWVLTCSAKTRVEQQRLQTIIQKLHEVALPLGQEVYRDLKPKK